MSTCSGALRADWYILAVDGLRNDQAPDWAFAVTVSNKQENCNELDVWLKIPTRVRFGWGLCSYR